MIIFANLLLDKPLVTTATATVTTLLLMAVASTMRTTPRVTPMRAR